MIRSALDNLVSKPGVYKFKDNLGKIIYVGASKNLKNRVSSYFYKKQDNPRLQKLVNAIDNIEYEVIHSANAAFLRERELINLHKPNFNVRWMDDKQYPFLVVTTSEKFPRINIVRHEKEDKNKYFGRQTSIGPLRDSLKHLRKIFPTCDCQKPVQPSIKKRPCLNYDLGLCTAPCAKKVGSDIYQKNIGQLIQFLEGESGTLLDQWREEMNLEASTLQFEKAGQIRDRILAVQKLADPLDKYNQTMSYDAIGYAKLGETFAIVVLTINNQSILNQQEYLIQNQEIISLDQFLLSGLKIHYQKRKILPNLILLPVELVPEDSDFFYEWLNQDKSSPPVKMQVFSNPSDNKWLKIAMNAANKAIERNTGYFAVENPNYKQIQLDLRNILKISKKNVSLIECIDISTLQGTHTVGSIVAFKYGIPYKSYYRRYKVKTINKPDDPGAMKEVLTRHFNRKIKDKLDYPDVLLVDGGKSQLSAVRHVFQSLDIDIPYLGLTKRHEELILPGAKNPIKLPRISPTLRLLVALRDEAHRFAITYNRKLRKSEKINDNTGLQYIKGLGPVKRKALIIYFRTVSKIKKASILELSEVVGINEKLAEEIYNYFHP